MRTPMLAGILLIVLGVVALTYHGITYVERKDIVNIGPIHATEEHEKTVPLPPIFGALAIAGGVLVLVYGSKRA
jgi:hypothetical protein